MKSVVRALALGLVFVLLPSLGWPQSTERSEMDQWLKMTKTQKDIPIGTTITMSNWQQYQDVMPHGMIKLFQRQYGWTMPPDVRITVGPSHAGGNLPSTWVAATEKYGQQTGVEVLPNGHYVLKNYYGGTPFPNPQDPYKGWKILANVFWAFMPALYVNSPSNYGTVWAVNRFGNNITDPGFSRTETYAGYLVHRVGNAGDARTGALYRPTPALLHKPGVKSLPRHLRVRAGLAPLAAAVRRARAARRYSASTGPTTMPRPMASTAARQFIPATISVIARS